MRFCVILFLIVPMLSGVVLADTSMKSVDDVMEQYREKVERRLIPRFRFANVEWPPQAVSLVTFKDTRLMELWVQDKERWVHIKDYRVKGMSGHAGPKLREGDRQVPEGFYRIERLNPNSAFHLSIKLDYPNDFDRERAKIDRRRSLGGNIFIHGESVSSGCLAMGNNAVEELFVLTALLGEDKVSVLISPRDYRFRPYVPLLPGVPQWAYGLNMVIAANLKKFPLETK